MYGFKNKCLNQVIACIATFTLILLPLQIKAQAVHEDPTALEMMFDGIVSRPITLFATAAGAAVWVVTLPFSLLGGNAGDAADKLILYPAKATFIRCLGCKNPGRKVDYADELEDLQEDDFDDDFGDNQSERADTDPYGVASDEDYASELRQAPNDSSTLSYDESGEDQIFEEGIQEDDSSFFDMQAFDETEETSELIEENEDFGFSEEVLDQGFIFDEETTVIEEDYEF